MVTAAVSGIPVHPIDLLIAGVMVDCQWIIDVGDCEGWYEVGRGTEDVHTPDLLLAGVQQELAVHCNMYTTYRSDGQCAGGHSNQVDKIGFPRLG